MHMSHLPRTLPSLLRETVRYNTRSFGSHVSLPIGNFSYKWLRDSCPSAESIHPSTRQKLHRTTDAVKDAKPKSVSADKDGLRIEWQSGHKSFYPTDYLARYSSYGRLSAFHHDVRQQPWNLIKISANEQLFIPYESVKTDPGRLTAMTQLERDGLVFIQGVPNVETSNEKCELRRVTEAFGEIRDTFYGPLWDVKDTKNSRNIAYTNLDLGLHMDLLWVSCSRSFWISYLLVTRYFEHPPRYQFLHCLRNRVEGGASMFVDALNAANTLRITSPSDFDILTTTPVSFHYINDGHHLHYDHPTIQLGAFPDKKGILPIKCINYSPPFQAPLHLSTPPQFYDALEKFVGILESPENRYEYLLKEGDVVVFDNRRILHARTAFSSKNHEDDDGTDRWLKGCYIEADTVSDRARVLRSKA
jgi:gamma-butyrobetaine dioxygenase